MPWRWAFDWVASVRCLRRRVRASSNAKRWMRVTPARVKTDVSGYVAAVLEVVVAAPREVLDLEAEAAVAAGQHFEHLEPRGDHLDADAVARDRRNPVFTHGRPRN